jgi:hypothetical protein
LRSYLSPECEWGRILSRSGPDATRSVARWDYFAAFAFGLSVVPLPCAAEL